jgi:hypothetical protein
MSFFEKLLESGAPWWAVMGLIVFVVASALLAAVLAPNLLRHRVRREAVTQHQNVIVHNHSADHGAAHGTDNPFERVDRGRSNCAATSRSRLAQELNMLKSEGDEVHVHELPPEKE